MLYVCIFLVSVFISSLSQIILKTSANTHYESKIREYLNFKVIVSYGIFFLSSLMTVLAYKGVPLSMGPVFEASGYVWVAILSRLILKETIKKKKIAGLILIILGIVISSIGL